jgi:hypothetical protein
LRRYIILQNLNGTVWAATTKNEDYMQLQGLKRVVNDPEHRKEFVAGNMANYVTQSSEMMVIVNMYALLIIVSVVFRKALARVGDHADDFYETYREYRQRERFGLGMLFKDSLSELPQVSTF